MTGAATGLTWRAGDAAVQTAEVGGIFIASVYPRQWSSCFFAVVRPCASANEGKALVEAEWARWMEHAGLSWQQQPFQRSIAGGVGRPAHSG